MNFEGKKIVLRSVVAADADFLYELENDKSVWQVSGTKKSFTRKEIKNFILNQKDIYLDKQLRLMICPSPHSPGSGAPVLKKRGAGNGSFGCIDLFNFNEQHLLAGIGILIDKKHRKKGYANEALSLLINYAFEILNLQKLYCNIAEENKASLQLFKKNKFRITGRNEGVYSLQLVNNRP